MATENGVTVKGGNVKVATDAGATELAVTVPPVEPVVVALSTPRPVFELMFPLVIVAPPSPEPMTELLDSNLVPAFTLAIVSVLAVVSDEVKALLIFSVLDNVNPVAVTGIREIGVAIVPVVVTSAGALRVVAVALVFEAPVVLTTPCPIPATVTFLPVVSMFNGLAELAGVNVPEDIKVPEREPAEKLASLVVFAALVFDSLLVALFTAMLLSRLVGVRRDNFAIVVAIIGAVVKAAIERLAWTPTAPKPRIAIMQII